MSASRFGRAAVCWLALLSFGFLPTHAQDAANSGGNNNDAVTDDIEQSRLTDADSLYILRRTGGLPRYAVYMFTRHFACPPCLRSDANIASPLIRGHWHLEQVNTATDTVMARAFNITATPTFVAMHEGREIGRVVGPTSPLQVTNLFSAYIPSK